MGGIGGLIRLENATPQTHMATVAEKLIPALRRVGANARWTSPGPQAEMTFCSFTEEALELQQPLRDRDQWVTFDGRLDNRDELRGRLRELPPDAADAAIVLRAYRAWGPECVERLVGDFALAIWDAPRRRLLLARDAFGIKPLYFVNRPGELVWSSTTDSLLPFVTTAAIDKVFVASYLWFAPDERRSPFAEISPVAPGHYLIYEDGQIRNVCYWRIADAVNVIRYKSDIAYEEHFLEHFSRAVRSRLRATGPVTIEVSGGLDSSSIACVAAELLGDCAPQRLRTISFVYPQHSTTDERDYITAVEERVGVPHFHVEETVHTLLSRSAVDTFTAHPTPLLGCPGRVDGPSSLLAAQGSRIVLSGEGGDAAFRNDEMYPNLSRDRFAIGVELNFGRRLIDWSWGEGWTIWTLLRHSLMPDLFGNSGPMPGIPEWFGPSLTNAAGLDEYRKDVTSRWRVDGDAALQRQCATLMMNRAALATGGQGYAVGHWAEVRYPYLDLPLLRFLLSIPSDQLWRPGQRRSIMRRALAGILPDVVRVRRTKATGDGALMAAVEANFSWLRSLVDKGIAVESGLVDRAVMLDLLQGIRFGRSGLQVFLRYVAVELWLRNVHTARQPVEECVNA